MKLKSFAVSCLFLFQILLALKSFAQPVGVIYKRTVQVSYFCPGYLDYLPVGYNPADANVKYPLMIYFMGLGTGGNGDSTTANGLERLYTGSNAPHEQVRNGSWQDAYTVPSGTYRFVIVTPQYNSRNPADLNHTPSPAEVDSLITHAINSHANKIDTTRIYIAGHSQGAGVPWMYTGEKSRYANRIAAMLPISGVMLPNLEKAWRIKYGKVAVWAFHNSEDNLVPFTFTKDFVNYVNNEPAPAIPAKLTSLGSTGHDVGAALLRGPIPGETYNVFQWMLLHQRTNTTVFAGEDQFIYSPANSIQLAGSDRRTPGNIISTTWTQISGPASSTIVSPNSLTTTVNNLVRGVYIFRLTVTDNASVSYQDDVAVQVGPPLIRIQAESYLPSSSTGFVVENSPSEGEPVVRLWSSQRNLDYTVTVPATSTYLLRIRAGAFVGDQKFVIEKPDGTRLDTVRVYPQAFDKYLDWYARIPLEAGTQTIRFRNTSQPTPVPPGNEWQETQFNWFEIFNEANSVLLPVSFAQFNLRCSSGNVDLFWTTSAESSLKEFRLQRSSNGANWTTVYTVASANQTNGGRYAYTDVRPSGNQLYRVVAIDIDGRETISSISRAQCGGRSSINVFPNPVKNTATLSLYLEKNTTMRLSLYDAKGAMVKESVHQLQQGVTQLPFAMDGLPKGTYSLRAAWSDEVKTIKLIKE